MRHREVRQRDLRTGQQRPVRLADARADWLGEVLLLPARDRPDEPAITWARDGLGAEVRTYRELLDGALRAAGGLRESGVRAGQRIVVALGTGWQFLDAFFGATLLGAVPVPTAPPQSSRPADLKVWVQGLTRLVEDCGSGLALVPERHREAVRGLSTAELSLPCPDLGRAGGAALDPADVEEPGDTSAVAMLQYTSGTTGTPRGVPLTHRNLMANAAAIDAALRPIPEEVTVSWLPLFHDMGLLGTVVTVLRAQKPLVLMSPQDFVRRPMSWLRAISEHRGTITAAPNFAFEYCVRRLARDELQGVDLSSLRIALNGAEPVDLPAVRRFHEVFSEFGLRPHVVRPVYGLAEATLAVTFTGPGSCRVDRRTPGEPERVSVGEPLQGVELQVRANGDEAATAPLPDREVGEIWVRGASVTSDGWLATGDLGYLAEGELFITGRSRDLIIRRGRNLVPQDLEARASSVDGVRGGAVVAFGDGEDIWVVAETRVRGDDKRRATEAAVRERLAAAFGFAPSVGLVRVGALPRTTSGKLRRSAAAERFGPDRA